MHCDNNCFEDYVVKCPTALNVYAQLFANTNYQWLLTDRNGKKYAGNFTTDDNGFWSIPVSELPDGILSQGTGAFTLEVLDAVSCKPIKFKIAQEYKCIKFDVKGGTFEKDNLGCDFTVSPNNQLRTVIPFDGTPADTRIILDSENNIVFSNEGASALVGFKLPAAVRGKSFGFVVQNANGINIVRTTGNVINVGADSGNVIVSSVVPGSYISLLAINEVEWTATIITGTWSS